MDDDQQFCLRWNNHQSTLISVFDTLLENETLVDCTLAAEGKFLKAHKVVLSACSPYFATLLSEQYDKHPIFILKDVKYQELRAMMDYMYRGEVNISQDQLAALLKAAESLQIKGLSDNRTGSGNSSSQQHQQKISAEQQQHKHISVPGKMMTGSASAGYTLEQTKRSRIGPSSIDSQDLSGSREGSSSPTSRRRKKVRRRSIENVMADNHDNSNSSQVIQAGTSSIVPTTNATGTITSMLPIVGSGVSGTTTTIAGTIASTVAAATSSLQQQHHQQQQTSAATAAANIITANVTKKTESVKMGNTDAMNAAATAVENIQDENAADSVDEKEMMMKEKLNHKRPKHHHEGGATSTGKEEIVIEPKSEYDDEGNDETVEDLTLDDEEMGLEDLDHNAGPSHGGEGSSQGYAQWQVDRSQDEVFMAAQEAQQRDPQDLSKKVINHNKNPKNSVLENSKNVNRHSMNGMEAMSAAGSINNKKRFSVSDVSDMLYEFYRANAAAKAPKTENIEKSFRQKSPSSADAAAGGEGGSVQSGMPNEPQTSKTTASKNSNGDEMTNTNKIGATKSAICAKKNTSSFHPRIKYSSVMNKSNAAAATAALANMENTPACIPTSVVVPPPDVKPILPIPASVIKPPTIGAAAPAAAAIAAALLRDGYHNFQQQLRNQDIFKQQSNLMPLAHNNQSGGSVQPMGVVNKSLIFDNFDRKENRFSENEIDNSGSEFDEDDDDEDDDGRYSGFDDIHLIEGSKSSFSHHPNATMPCLSTDYMSDESQKLMMAAQAQALRHLEYSLSDYGGGNPNEEANYQCRHCGKKYRWKSTLRRHENVECGGKEPAHQCPYCAYKSKQRGNLGVHVRKHHSNLPQLASKRRSKYSQQREVKIEKAEKAF